MTIKECRRRTAGRVIRLIIGSLITLACTALPIACYIVGNGIISLFLVPILIPVIFAGMKLIDSGIVNMKVSQKVKALVLSFLFISLSLVWTLSLCYLGKSDIAFLLALPWHGGAVYLIIKNFCCPKCLSPEKEQKPTAPSELEENA